jgi:hypothetical protein
MATSSSLSELESTIVTGLIAFLRWLRRGITKVGWRENQMLKTREDKIKKCSSLYTNFQPIKSGPICSQKRKNKGRDTVSIEDQAKLSRKDELQHQI